MQPTLQMPLTFSSGGKHFAWGYDNCIFMDGKPGPANRATHPRCSSAPTARVMPTRARNQAATPNGRSWTAQAGANYFGEINQFAPNNHLISLYPDPAGGATIFVMDGKPEFKAAGVGRVWISPDSKQIAVQLTPAPNSPQELTVNGKVVPGTQGAGIVNVYFSPDGKRYAVNCSHFMIIDGKQQDDYSSLPDGELPPAMCSRSNGFIP